MKKLLTALLMVAMVLSLCSVAFAAEYSDTQDLNKNTQASISKLSALKIVDGYPDGTFKPGNTITRAEFAKIATIVGGMDRSSDVLKNSASKFKDVATGQWYTGYINLAASQNWVKGYPDGTFKPNANISYAEVVTVMLRLLGYNDNLPGPWPVDYIAKAGSLNVTKYVSFDATNAANRGDVVVMADNTLDCNVVKWDVDSEDFIYKYGPKTADQVTLLEENFDSAVNEDYLISEVKYDQKTWKIKVEAWGDDKDLSGWYDLADNIVIANGALPTGLGDKIADIIYNSDDEEVSFIEITSTMITVDGDDWKVNKTDTKTGDPTQYEIDKKKYDVAEKVNGTLLKTFDKNLYYRAWLDSDGEVYQVKPRPVATPAIVDSYKDSNQKLTFKNGSGTYFNESNVNFKDNDVLIEKDGAFIKVEDLKENDVVYIGKDIYGYDYHIDVYNISKSGTFQSFKEGSSAPSQIRIDGTWYDVACNLTTWTDTSKLSRKDGKDFDKKIDKKGLEDSYGKTVKFFLNRNNQVTFIISDVDGSGSDSNYTYGVVTSTATTGGGSAQAKINKITVMRNDGTEASYAIDTSDVELRYKGSAGANKTTNELDVDDFVKFTVNENNEIDGMTILAYWNEVTKTIEDPKTYAAVADYVDSDNSDYHGLIADGDKDNMRIKFQKAGVDTWLDISNATIVFNSFLDDAFGSDDDEASIERNIDLVDWAEKEGIAGKTYQAYVQYDSGHVEYIYLKADVSGADADYAAVIDTYFYDGDYWVDVNIEGKEVSYKLKDQSASKRPADGTLYEYAISSGKFEAKTEIFNPDVFQAANPTLTTTSGNPGSVSGNEYAQVTDVRSSSKGVKINDVWYYADEDTVIYDYSDWYDTDKDPVFSKDVADITEDDYIIFIDNGDGKNIASIFIILNYIN